MFKRYRHSYEDDTAIGTVMENTSQAASPHQATMNRPNTEKVSYSNDGPTHFHSNSVSEEELIEPSFREENTAKEPEPIPKQESYWSPPLFGQNESNEPIETEKPETTLGEGVLFKGELSFERLLRIDGVMEGKLFSNGKIIVGASGSVAADITMREAIIEGQVEGNITVERLELRGKASVYGDICARSIIVDEDATLVGHVSVKPTERENSY